MPDEADALETLAKLVQQIQGSGYQNEAGPLELNVAYRDAVALLKLRGALPKPLGR